VFQKMHHSVLAAMASFAFCLVGAALPDSAGAHDASEGHEGHATQGFAAGEPGAHHAPSRTVEVVMRDAGGAMVFEPDTLEVGQGEQVRFVLQNAGALEHEFLIDTAENNAAHKAAMAAEPGMQHEEPNGRRLKPGETTELVWRFTKPGTFEVACLIPGHYEAGMKGTVTVK
jgi:uncharacterized cupredoxin-like copper-binding protein